MGIVEGDLIPEGVDVETMTFISFSDNRPTEVVMAGTVDDRMKHIRLNERGSYSLKIALFDIFVGDGVGEVLFDGDANDR